MKAIKILTLLLLFTPSVINPRISDTRILELELEFVKRTLRQNILKNKILLQEMEIKMMVENEKGYEYK